MNPLPVTPAHRLADRAEQQRWLVSGLWSEQAVGIIGGEPKCCKSFLALDLAVSVAAGTPCLRRFTVPTPGRVLLYAAEDALHVVRRRLDGICAAGEESLADLLAQQGTLRRHRPGRHQRQPEFRRHGDLFRRAAFVSCGSQGRG